MSPFVRLGVGIVLLAAVLVAVAFALPQHMSVARSTVINAPESDVFAYVNDLHKFKEWSPWAAGDPNMQYTFSGAEAGAGAHMDWKSEQFGSGSQEILESRRNVFVKSRLDSDGMGTALFSYRLDPSGAGTRLTWSLDADMGNNPLMRWAGLVYARAVGADFEQGLQRLQKLVEANR